MKTNEGVQEQLYVF